MTGIKYFCRNGKRDEDRSTKTTAFGLFSIHSDDGLIVTIRSKNLQKNLDIFRIGFYNSGDGVVL